MKTKTYLILTASVFLLLLTAVNPTLAQNHAERFFGGFERLERRAVSSNLTTQFKPPVEDSSPDSIGTLDMTFGTGGRAITALPEDNFTQKMAIQPDGRIVVQGRGFTLDGSFANNFLVRYHPNGTLDNSFGTNGSVIIPSNTPTFEDFQYGLAITPDGKILVSGDVYNLATEEADFAVFRFNVNGSRDASFGTNGVVTAPVGASDDYGYTLQVQPNGKIVVVGFVRSETDLFKSDVGLVRFNHDGTIDTAFGSNGKLIIPIQGNTNFALAFDFELLPDGKILLIGRTTDANIASKKVFLARVNPNGTLDASFGANGILLPEINQLDNSAFEIARQSNGKIVFTTGNLSGGAFQSSTVVRLNPDGSFDNSFGTGGKTVIPASEGSFSFCVEIRSNGKILAARSAGTPLRFAIVQLNAEGSRDTSFGTNGIIKTAVGQLNNILGDIALQPDGKLVAYGDVEITDGEPYDIGLVRCLLDTPAAPPFFDFDGDGRADVSVFRAGTWYRLNSSNDAFNGAQFGIASDKITTADYDGDLRSDIAVFRSGTWYILQSSTNSVRTVAFGQAGDVPLPGDYDGDGKADVAVFRDGNWFILNSLNNSLRAVQFGNATDAPVEAAYLP